MFAHVPALVNVVEFVAVYARIPQLAAGRLRGTFLDADIARAAFTPGDGLADFLEPVVRQHAGEAYPRPELFRYQ